VVEKEKDDLVAFLRNPLDYPPRMTVEVFNEAADEIERLTLSNASCENSCANLWHRLRESDAEIERLRACEYRCPDICPYCSRKLGQTTHPHSNSPQSDGSKG
jgi:hypothetical protein